MSRSIGIRYPRGGAEEWVRGDPASTILQNEFFGAPLVPGIVSLSKSESLTFNVRTSLVDPTSFNFNIRQTLSDDSFLSYFVRSLLEKQYSLDFILRSSLQDTQGISYLVRQSLNSQTTPSYNIRALQNSSLLNNYSIRSVLQDSQSVSYNVLSSLLDSQGFNYNLRGNLPKNFNLSYSILSSAQISSERLIQYMVRTSQAKNALQNWNIRSNQGSSNSLTYLVRQLLTKQSNSFAYNVRRIEFSSSVLQSNIRGLVASSTLNNWNLRNSLVDNQGLNYNLRSSLNKTSDGIIYNVRSFELSDLELNSFIRSLISSDLNLSYGISLLVKVQSSLGLAYEIFNIIVDDSSTVYILVEKQFDARLISEKTQDVFFNSEPVYVLTLEDE